MATVSYRGKESKSLYGDWIKHCGHLIELATRGLTGSTVLASNLYLIAPVLSLGDLMLW